MSEERWKRRGVGEWFWLVPTGRHEITRSSVGLGLRTNGHYQRLEATELVAAFREAERIIADRCRETLKLLGE